MLFNLRLKPSKLRVSVCDILYYYYFENNTLRLESPAEKHHNFRGHFSVFFFSAIQTRSISTESFFVNVSFMIFISNQNCNYVKLKKTDQTIRITYIRERIYSLHIFLVIASLILSHENTPSSKKDVHTQM